VVLGEPGCAEEKEEGEIPFPVKATRFCSRGIPGV
jgi:hypothetical protein